MTAFFHIIYNSLFPNILQFTAIDLWGHPMNAHPLPRCSYSPHRSNTSSLYYSLRSVAKPSQAKPSQAKPSQAKPSQAKVLTMGGDLREAQLDVPLSVSHSCV
jgi:hypothetical protein